jgi:integration host factor subunit alpha
MSKTLTRADIIESIRSELDLPKNRCAEMVETILEIIKRTLASGEDVLITGFGKFNVKNKKERRGRNPATDEDLMLEPRKVVTFKCSGRLRDRINGA